MTGWFFRELDPGIVRRTSHEEEFFIASTKVDAMVREAVQNSIDAKQSGEETVMVRFHVGRTNDRDGDFLLSGLIEHLIAAGLNVDMDIEFRGLRFLAIEDFHTTGLVGELDPSSRSAQLGDFYNFWWADGSLKKKGQSGGRWGLGKNTFFVSSKLKTFWGLSVRDNSPQKILMGRCQLKPHIIKDKLYNQDGFFVSSLNFNPVVDDDKIKDFMRIFNLKREQHHGLSIVIPLPFDEVDSDTIMKAVLDQYLFSIVRDQVRINISELRNGSTSSEILNKNTIFDVLGKKKNGSKIFTRYLNLASLYDTVQKSEFNFVLNTRDPLRPEINEESFGSAINDLRKVYNNLETKFPIKLKVPLRVIDSSNVPKETYYEIVIAKSDDAPKKRVLCFRSGILVSEAISMDTEGLAVMLIADDDLIAQFLGDAENPSHMKWSVRSENFTGKYMNGKDILTFVMESPEKVLKILKEEPENRDVDLLADIFYIDVEPNVTIPRQGRPLVPNITKEPKLFSIGKTEDGFYVSVKERETDNSVYPFNCKVETSYMVRSGNPLKKYDPNDFVLSKPPIELKVSGSGTLIHVGNNSVKVRIEGPDFVLRVKGFDENRDLYVRATKLDEGGESADY